MNHEDKCRIDRLEARIHQLECASIPEPDREPDKVPQESQREDGLRSEEAPEPDDSAPPAPSM